MNRNPKEKPARIEIRTEPSKKKKIKQLADKCNLPVSEYMVQRALGYEPKSVLPDGFDWYLRFDGDPNDPLRCTTTGKRKTTTQIQVAGVNSPTMNSSDTGCTQKQVGLLFPLLPLSFEQAASLSKS